MTNDNKTEFEYKTELLPWSVDGKFMTIKDKSGQKIVSLYGTPEKRQALAGMMVSWSQMELLRRAQQAQIASSPPPRPPEPFDPRRPFAGWRRQ